MVHGRLGVPRRSIVIPSARTIGRRVTLPVLWAALGWLCPFASEFVLTSSNRARRARAARGLVALYNRARVTEAPLETHPPADLDWTPLRPGGAIFRTHHLLVTAPQRIELQPSKSARALVMSFAVVGLASPCVAAWWFVTYSDAGALVVGAMLFVVCLVLVLLLRKQLDNRRVFDAELGRYSSTREPLELPLARIRALQITRERVIGPDSDFDSDELNLILDEGQRVNVIDHGDSANLLADARTLAAWLGVPLWVRPDLLAKTAQR